MKENEPPQTPDTGEGETPKPLFKLGLVVGTPGALQALEDAKQNPMELLLRHNAGDWGDVCEDDALENKLAVDQGFRVFSVYSLDTGKKVWVITEWDVRLGTVCEIASDFAAGDSPTTCDLSLLTRRRNPMGTIACRRSPLRKAKDFQDDVAKGSVYGKS